MNTGDFFLLIGDALTVLGVIILGFMAVVWLASRVLEAKVNKALEQVAEELAQNKLIPLTIEQYQNQLLCYNSLTNDFVCQGGDVKEIIAKFRQRYPNKSASIYAGDEALINALKQQLQEIKNENSDSIRRTS